jgi:hypothetical protein
VQIGFELAAPKFIQLLPGGLALVKLDLFSRTGMPAFPQRERVLPVEFRAMQVHEHIRIVLPDGFEAEELPAPVVSKEAFASYENRVELRDGAPELTGWDLEDASVPVAEYDRAPVVAESPRTRAGCEVRRPLTGGAMAERAFGICSSRKNPCSSCGPPVF